MGIEKHDDKKWWKNSWAEREDGFLLMDEEVAKYAWKHLRFRDKINLRAITSAVIWSHLFLMQPEEAPKKKKWKFGDEDIF